MAIWSKVLTANPLPADMSEDSATDGYALVKKTGETKLGWASIPGNYSLPTASSSTKGGIKIPSDTEQTVSPNAVSSTASRTYSVQLTSSDTAVVNVPWTDSNTQNAYSTSIPSSTTKLRLSGTGAAGSTSDDIEFVGSGATTVTRTNASKFTISSTDTNTTTTAAVKTALGAAMPSNALTIGDVDSTITIPGILSVATINYDNTNETNLNVTDKTITVADGAGSEAAASGAGLTVDTGQSGLIPDLKWYNDSTTKNTSGCIGLGWQVKATNEGTTKYHLMGFRSGSGAPTSTTNSTSTKSEGEGAFYFDTTNQYLYICTDSNSSAGGG